MQARVLRESLRPKDRREKMIPFFDKCPQAVSGRLVAQNWLGAKARQTHSRSELAEPKAPSPCDERSRSAPDTSAGGAQAVSLSAAERLVAGIESAVRKTQTENILE